MHAYSLYQRVLQHEDAVEKAKKEGAPLPVFDPTIPRMTTETTVQPSEEIQKQWKEKLEQLPESERAAEEAALRADLQNKSDVARTMREYYEAHRKPRDDKARPEAGSEKSLAETLTSLVTGR